MSTKLRKYKTSSRRKKVALAIGIALVLITTTVLIVWFAGRGEKDQKTPKKPSSSSGTGISSTTKSAGNSDGDWYKSSGSKDNNSVFKDFMIPMIYFIDNDIHGIDLKKCSWNESNPLEPLKNDIDNGIELFNNFNALGNSYFNRMKMLDERIIVEEEKEKYLAIDMLGYIKQLNKFYESLEMAINKPEETEHTGEKDLIKKIMANTLFGLPFIHLVSLIPLHGKKLSVIKKNLDNDPILQNLSQQYAKEMLKLVKEAYGENSTTETLNKKQMNIHWIKDWDKFLKLANNVVGLIYLTVFTVDKELKVTGVYEPIFKFLNTNLKDTEKKKKRNQCMINVLELF